MITLKATIRQEKDHLKDLREKGFIPAVLYGEGLKNINFSVEERPFSIAFKEIGETSTLELDIAGKKYQALIHQTTYDPLSEKIIHLDFFHPSLKKKITAEVPLVFIGEPPAVKDLGGILEKELTSLAIKGLVKDMPHEIKVDLSSLKAFGDKIVVGDLNIPNEVETEHNEKDNIVVHIAEPRKEPEPEEKKPVEETTEGAPETATQEESNKEKKEEKAKPKK
ncbi:50S ribosomal protein L25 [Candidatus Parcubacteria bacterium]|nr:50S ribosomal protein L25 [Candidatus Parcubacteria bacterium]